ncbi:MAG: hypothetical protein ACSLEL_02545 [Candidatus Malihini olakiniferum]
MRKQYDERGTNYVSDTVLDFAGLLYCFLQKNPIVLSHHKCGVGEELFSGKHLFFCRIFQIGDAVEDVVNRL